MSYPTVQAYVQHVKGWEPRCREHPVLDWLFDYEVAFDWGDMKSGPYTTWHTDDFSFTKSTGERIAAGAPSWAAVLEIVAPFSAHYFEPFFGVIWETPTGYEFIGLAKIFGKLHAPGEQTKTDLEGRKWDVEAPVASYFEFVKDTSGPKGLKLKNQQLYGDGIPMIGEMVKRGMVTPEQVLAHAS